MVARKRFDIEKIERLYRAGQMSVREIAANIGCSHTYIQQLARKHGWQRDLSHLVKQEIANKLVAKLAKTGNDAETVDIASDIGVAIVESHRKDIKRLRDLETKLVKAVAGNPTKLYLAQYQGNVVEKEVALTASECAQAANNLANVQEKRIRLERQAYNLNTEDDSGEGMPVLSYDAVNKPADSGLGFDEESGD